MILEVLVKNIEVSKIRDLKTIPTSVLEQITLETPTENTLNMASAAEDSNLPSLLPGFAMWKQQSKVLGCGAATLFWPKICHL